MQIEKIIINAVNLSKVSGIPVLFFSNPGYGKTTILKEYAEKNGMHLESLIGSRFGSAPEEISGYQVNKGGSHLEHMNPEWFDRIWQKEKEHIPTLLFIDELSTCSDAVQGTLLSLIFERTIGSGKKLPESTLIVSAANYASNLSSGMNILAPTLNRFIIFNLTENYSGLDMVEEFLGESSNQAYSYSIFEIPAELEIQFKENFKNLWREIFLKYSDTESSLGVLDINNAELDNLYTDGERTVYNFISGRTLSYLQRALLAYIKLKINDKAFLYKLIDGLVGNGTCSFKDEKQCDHYRNFIHKSIDKIVALKKKVSKPLPEITGDISKDVAAFMIGKENLDTTVEDEVLKSMELVEEINKQFKIENVIELGKTQEGVAKFISDYEAVKELQQFCRNYPDSRNITSQLTKIGMDYYEFYSSILGIKMDFENEFGLKNNLFKYVCFIKKEENTKGKFSYMRAAVRFADKKSLPSFYEIPDDVSFFEAKLSKPIHPDSRLRIIRWNNGFKLNSVEDYQRNLILNTNVA